MYTLAPPQVYTPTIGCVLQRIISLAWPDLRRSKVATGNHPARGAVPNVADLLRLYQDQLLAPCPA